MARAVIIASILCLAGCATQNDAKPAVCDGQHRRPANPYGSVLPSAPAATGSAPDATKVGPLSSIESRSFQPCGGRA